MLPSVVNERAGKTSTLLGLQFSVKNAVQDVWTEYTGRVHTSHHPVALTRYSRESRIENRLMLPPSFKPMSQLMLDKKNKIPTTISSFQTRLDRLYEPSLNMFTPGLKINSNNTISL